ncbi:hypothetical protein ACEWY4_007826 [Coilia grayii]|uniref:Gypsy retrotransposon integrase-like protein 1 n=1 Tax=Coilia grayii TaxID=363190 RepID=A0ABD1K968_9TELE
MEGLLAGIDHLDVVYLDDILLKSISEDQHLRTLDIVLSWLEEAGLRLKRSECVSLWPLTCPASDFLPYFKRRDEITVEDGVLLWGLRVIILPRGRKALMEELHEAHPGVSRMKAVARAYMWWPGLDTALEDLVKSCTASQQIRNALPEAPVCPWEWPGKP